MKKIIVILLATFSLVSCEKAILSKRAYKVVSPTAHQKFKQGSDVDFTLENTKDVTADSIVYYIDNKRIKNTLETNFKFKLDNKKVGLHNLKAKVYQDNKMIAFAVAVIELAPNAPEVYNYKIIKSYPHDRYAYTQGLEFIDGVLYESTGERGQSTLRKVNLADGKVLQKIDLDKKYFGEGITVLNDKIYQLTWQSGVGFVYNKVTFEKEKTFNYKHSTEGWGLCNDGTNIYKSDGTNAIWTLDPNTLSEKSMISVATNTAIIPKLNELEWVNGKIYANIYQKNAIVVIDPKTGIVEKVMNMQGLRDKVLQHNQLDVLNGIAYNAANKHFYITGKNWNKLFEIEFVK